MEEVDFHSFVILYWKLSLMWPGGEGRRSGGKEKNGGRTPDPSCPAAASPPGLFPRPHQPTRCMDLRSQRPHYGREKEERKAEASGLGRETLLRRQPHRRCSKRTQRLRRDRFPPVGEGTLQPPPPLPEREASRCGQVGGSLGRPGSPSAAPCGAAGAARSVSFRRAGPGSLPSPPPSRLYTRTIDPASTPPYPGTICAARGGF